VNAKKSLGRKMKGPKLLAGIFAGIIFIAVFLSYVALSFQFNNEDVISVKELIKNPDEFLNQTVTVKGVLSSLPMPSPEKYKLSFDYSQKTERCYVSWNATKPLFLRSEGVCVVVHGVFRDEDWVDPYFPNAAPEHVYYIEASMIR
jgi:cytochrome c-type biogenesis protein CcmE